ncbi:MAG: hypothetical protein FWE03_06540 [Firmicutes bacterium]|nr:hypothetical protein [Bacillota bacterium]
MQDPYRILGLPAASPDEMLIARYQELRARFSEERFLEGEAGNEGARRLMELEDAWQFIKQDMHKRSMGASQNADGSFNADGGLVIVEALIKSGRFTEAQSELDSITIRDAEWHYYQAIVYYKREWLTESRNHLNIAISLDPNNTKYQEAAARLNNVMGNPNINPQSVGGQGNFNNMHGGRPAEAAGNALCRCCQAWACMECLCCFASGCCR